MSDSSSAPVPSNRRKPSWWRVMSLFCLVLMFAQFTTMRSVEDWLQESLVIKPVWAIVIVGSIYVAMWAVVMFAFFRSEYRWLRAGNN